MSLEEILIMKNELMQKISAEGKLIIRQEFDKVFEAVPRLEGIMWRQYIPTFNDGDPCEFTVSDIYLAVKDLRVIDKETGKEHSGEETEWEEYEDDEEKDEGNIKFFDNWILCDGSKYYKIENPLTSEEITALMEVLILLRMKTKICFRRFLA